MAFTLVPDALWAEVEPLLPRERPKPLGGRPRVSDRACLTGIVYVLRTGMPWRLVPAELGCGSGVTCWRRLRDWTRAGVWRRIHEKILSLLGCRDLVHASVAVVDSASVRAVFGGRTPVPTPRIVRKRAANGTS
jgi:transposase